MVFVFPGASFGFGADARLEKSIFVRAGESEREKSSRILHFSPVNTQKQI